MYNYFIIENSPDYAELIQNNFMKSLDNCEDFCCQKICASDDETNDFIEDALIKRLNIHLVFIDYSITGGKGTDYIKKINEVFNNPYKIILSGEIPSEIKSEAQSQNTNIRYIEKGKNDEVKKKIGQILTDKFPKYATDNVQLQFGGKKKLFTRTIKYEDILLYCNLATFIELFHSKIIFVKNQFVEEIQRCELSQDYISKINTFFENPTNNIMRNHLTLQYILLTTANEFYLTVWSDKNLKLKDLKNKKQSLHLITINYQQLIINMDYVTKTTDRATKKDRYNFNDQREFTFINDSGENRNLKILINTGFRFPE